MVAISAIPCSARPVIRAQFARLALNTAGACAVGRLALGLILLDGHGGVAKVNLLHRVALNSQHFKLLRPTASRLIHRRKPVALLRGCDFLCLSAAHYAVFFFAAFFFDVPRATFKLLHAFGYFTPRLADIAFALAFCFAVNLAI